MIKGKNLKKKKMKQIKVVVDKALKKKHFCLWRREIHGHKTT